ncbi:ABC transporter ATP-binding protein [candidate division WOR-3 bacterium]|uniref:ABC transporter ATP-binding protein n=1 Tax=candidate division WOR-3 bacterium TaxID=2052148 RepID=A0A938BUR2_UNCW3|nr:ABC transporter ATP-binding protein [candidate division WOR-3 bacterium]
MASLSEPVISVTRLSKVYRSGFRMKRIQALTDISLEVERGEIFGFLGPNGAGKTTFIKVLMGLTEPTTGGALVFGRPPRDAAAKARLGFLPESPYFYDHLTAREFLSLATRLSAVPKSEAAGRITGLLRLLRMEIAADVQMRGFSRGMLQRMGIAQALVADPELVVLDEPMGGLDPIGRKEFRDIIVDLRDRGKTVFFSTHILSDVEMICDRVGIVIEGRMAEVGRLSEILTGEVESVEVTVRGVTGKTQKILERVSRHTIKSGDELLLTVKSEEEVEKIMAICREVGGIRVVGIVPHRPTLEDYFMAHVAQAGRKP